MADTTIERHVASDSDDSKIRAEHADEKARNGELSYDSEFASVDHKKTLRRMDLHIIPMVTTLYLLSFLDRGNIGNARVLGLATDTGLVRNQYSIALMVFFFPYA